MSVRMGAFDDDPGVRPSWRAFVADAAPWEAIPDDGLERITQGKPYAAPADRGCARSVRDTSRTRARVAQHGGARLRPVTRDVSGCYASVSRRRLPQLHSPRCSTWTPTWSGSA